MGWSQEMYGSDLNLTFLLPCSNLLGKGRGQCGCLILELSSSHRGLKAADTAGLEDS